MIPLSEITFGIPYISIFPCKKATCRGAPVCPPWARPYKKQHYRAVIYGPWAPPQSLKKLVGRASPPAAFGGTGFQPVHRTGKMPVPPRTFQDSPCRVRTAHLYHAQARRLCHQLINTFKKNSKMGGPGPQKRPAVAQPCRYQAERNCRNDRSWLTLTVPPLSKPYPGGARCGPPRCAIALAS
jgi:hypothetical protein